MEINPYDLHVDRFAAYKHDEVEDDENIEEQYYMKKIQELLDEKKRMLADHDNKLAADKKSEVKKKKKKKKKKATGFKRPRAFAEKDGGDKKKKMVIRTPAVSNHVTDELKEFIIREMNGSDMKLVIQKSLYATDLKKDQNRLSMPINQLETHEFLTVDEKRALERGGEFGVPLLGPKLRMHEKSMVLKMWQLKSTDNYVLKTRWNDFVKENEEDLKEDTKIQVWSFRRDQELCFAIACVDRPHGQNNAA